MDNHELLISRCIGAELENVRWVLKEAGGNPEKAADMTVRELVETCVRNGIALHLTHTGVTQ